MARKKQMYNNRYANMHKCAQYVLDNPDCGNSQIAKAVGLSRQAVNSIMADAVLRGYVEVYEIPWRSNAVAKRYRAGKYSQMVNVREWMK